MQKMYQYNVDIGLTPKNIQKISIWGIDTKAIWKMAAKAYIVLFYALLYFVFEH